MSDNTDPWAQATDPVPGPNDKSSGEGSDATGSDGAGAAAKAAKAAGESASSSADTEAKQAADKAAGEQEYADARAILDAVAAGDLSPDEASALLDELRAGSSSSAEGGAAGVPATQTTTKLRVRAVGRRVRLVGEPFVTTVAVDGPHVVRQEGDALVVTSEGEFGASLDGFTLTPPRNLRDVQQKFLDLGRELSIRVNPALLVEAEVTAGSITAERLPKLEQVRATAGSVRLKDIEGPIDMLVQAGSAQVEGAIAKGRSRLRVESGSMQLRLLSGSSVTIEPDVQLGRVVWEPSGGSDRDQHVVGGGDARLALEVVMGQATVKEAPRG